MRISSSSEYGTRIMVRLALSNGKGPVPAKDLSEKERIPRDYVDQLLMRLRRAGLVSSRRGAAGGYELGRAAAEITVADIVGAVEGGIFEEVCDKYSEGDLCCARQDGCSIRPVGQRLSSAIESFLRDVTLENLVDEEVPASLFERR